MAKQTVAEIFEKLRARLEPVLNELPQVVGNAAVNYTLDAFDKQGFEGKPWAKRKDKKDAGRALLIKSGTLRRSIRIIRSTQNSVIWGTDVPYARVHNDGLVINRAAHSETFVRPRYTKGKRAKYFGGMGAFRKMTTEEKAAAPGKGQSYKSYSYRMKQRQFIGDTPALRKHLNQVAKEEILKALKTIS